MKKFDRLDLLCLLPIIFFLFSTFSYWGQPPSLDAMVIYRESTQFFYSGVKEILVTGTRIHPPLIYLLNFLSFHIFGKNPGSYNLLGLIIFTISCLTLYSAARDIFGRKMAVPLIILIFCHPLIVINSFYPANDMLILMGTILAATSYIYGKKLYLSLALSLMVLMKETALVIILSFFFMMVIEQLISLRKTKKTAKNILTKMTTILPVFYPALVTFSLWRLFLKFQNTTEWQDSVFVHTTDSSFLVIIKKILSLQIFDIFLQQNLYNTFILNFQWVFIFLFPIVFLAVKKKNLLSSQKQKRFFYIYLISGLFYILLVFTFPTWTAPRYSIPIFLMLFTILTIIISKLPTIIYSIFLIGLMALLLIINFYSLDPFTASNKQFVVYGVNFYDFPYWNRGTDRFMYNLQILQATENQNIILKKAIALNTDIILTNCNELKLGEKLWSIYVHNDFYPEFNLQKEMKCINIGEEEKLDKMKDKIIYQPSLDYSFAPQGNI